MKKIILTVSVLALISLTSCNDSANQTNNKTASEKDAGLNDELVESTLTDKEGNKLEVIFNNKSDIATIDFDGETIVLKGQHPASGIWYKNEQYELRGKGDQVELTKEGVIIFKTFEMQ